VKSQQSGQEYGGHQCGRFNTAKNQDRQVQVMAKDPNVHAVPGLLGGDND
jgi:hypothetical protein